MNLEELKLKIKQTLYANSDRIIKFGDLSHLLPTIQPSIGGFNGVLHSKDFEITDKETAYIKAVEILTKTVVELLYDKAQRAEHVKESFKPKMTKAEYISYLNGKED